MFLIPPDSKTPYYQVVYFVNGKRTKKSTKAIDKKEAEKFLASFNPRQNIIPAVKPKDLFVNLSNFILEYKKYVSNAYSEKYLKKAVRPSLWLYKRISQI
jgi:alpha-acetolactate decarboxylase